MAQMKIPSRIRYEYVNDPTVRLNYSHGVWGGINPQGEIEMNFYLESDKMPPYSERRVEADGSFGLEMASFDEDIRVITRYIHSKVVVSYPTAKALLEWLEEKVSSIELEGNGHSFTVDGGNSNFEQ